MERLTDPLTTIDAKLWADEFMRVKARLGEQEFDHAMMLGWFANAIMQGYDEGQRRAKADAQATVEPLRRERDQWKEAFERSCDDTAYLKAAIDAEREKVKKLEANQVEYEKCTDEQIVALNQGCLDYEKELSQLQALVRALPCLDGEIKVKTYHHESERGQEWDEYECGDAEFDNLEAANVYAALLRYRATLDVTMPSREQHGTAQTNL